MKDNCPKLCFLFLVGAAFATSLIGQNTEQPKDAETYWKRVVEMMEKSEWDKAVAESNAMLRRYPKYRTAYMVRGSCYGNLKGYDKALADFSEAIRLDPKDSIAYRNRSHTYASKGDSLKALADLTEARRLDAR